jgi:hypothetical protein
MGSVSGLLTPLDGCYRDKRSVRAKERAAESTREPSDAGAADGAANVDTADTTDSLADARPARSAPVLRSTQLAVASGDSFAPFPCAVPLETPEAHAAGLAQGENEHYAADGARFERELEFQARSLRLSDDFDLVEVVRVSGPGSIGMVGDRLRAVPMVLARAGSPCSGASDTAQCERSVAEQRSALFADVSCRDEVCEKFDFTYALTTRGDQVHTYRGAKGLAQLLGAIDSPVEAWLMLAANGHAFTITCEDVVYAQQRTVPAGYELRTRMYTSSCKPVLQEDLRFRVTREGRVKLVQRSDVTRDEEGCVVSGRRPPALCARRSPPCEAAGALFARMAHLEAASVSAFEILFGELGALGADDALLARIERARKDELRHAQVMQRWAARHGHRAAPVELGARLARTEFDVALDNAVEGCVRELFGALVVSWQAARAQDAALRRDLARIARDEVSHSALSYDIAAWLEPRLSPTQRALLRGARYDALSALAEELVEPSAAQRVICGMPSLAESRALLRQLSAAWFAPGAGPLATRHETTARTGAHLC